MKFNNSISTYTNFPFVNNTIPVVFFNKLQLQILKVCRFTERQAQRSTAGGVPWCVQTTPNKVPVHYQQSCSSTARQTKPFLSNKPNTKTITAAWQLLNIWKTKEVSPQTRQKKILENSWRLTTCHVQVICHRKWAGATCYTSFQCNDTAVVNCLLGFEPLQ